MNRFFSEKDFRVPVTNQENKKVRKKQCENCENLLPQIFRKNYVKSTY